MKIYIHICPGICTECMWKDTFLPKVKDIWYERETLFIAMFKVFAFEFLLFSA